MNIIQLSYFKCVVEEKSVTKAAKKLFVTQSAVSQQIHLLAETLGCQLFYRRGRKLQITPDGEYIYQKAKSILSQLDILQDELKSRRENVVGKIRIGGGPIISKKLVPDVVSSMLKKYPGISFSLHEIYSKDLIQSLVESRIDLGLGQIDEENNQTHSEKLLSGRLVLICPSQTNWSSRKSISLKELSKINLIRRVSEVEHNRFSQIFSNNKENFHLEAMSTETIVPYVQRGMGMALAPDYIIKLMAPKEISIISLEEEITLSWGVIRDKSRPVSKAAQVFIDYLKQKLAKINLM